MAVIVDREPQTDKDVWQTARWAFVWLLRQALKHCPDISSTRLLFERGIALDGLHLHLLDPEEARTARRILLNVAMAAASGQLPPVAVDGRVLDEKSQEDFRNAASELVTLLSPGDSA